MELQARLGVDQALRAERDPETSTSIDWPYDYAELEPYYDKHEYFVGISGQHGNLNGTIDQRGNIFEGPRSVRTRIRRCGGPGSRT